MCKWKPTTKDANESVVRGQMPIPVWGDANIQEQLDGATRNMTIFVDISESCKNMAYGYNVEQSSKIVNSAAAYQTNRSLFYKSTKIGSIL